MQLSMIVAAAENNAIGKGNEMLWKLPKDFRFFKNTTWGLPIIMGSNTLKSLGKPLPGRTNIVLSRKGNLQENGIEIAANVEAAVQMAEACNVKEAYIIGGAEIYKQMLPLTTKILLTRVHHTFNEADAFFPELNKEEWEKTDAFPCFKDEQHAYDYTFETWQRIN